MIHDLCLVLAAGAAGALLLAGVVMILPQGEPRRQGFEVRRDRR